MSPNKKQKIELDGVVVAYNRNGAAERNDRSWKREQEDNEDLVQQLKAEIKRLEDVVDELKGAIVGMEGGLDGRRGGGGRNGGGGGGGTARADGALLVSPEANTTRAMEIHAEMAAARD